MDGRKNGKDNRKGVKDSGMAKKEDRKSETDSMRSGRGVRKDGWDGT